MECPLDIIGGSAFEGIAVLLLIDLGERTFDKSGSGAEDCHQPHPEGCARTARNDRSGHSRHIAGADAARGGDHQCLEGGNTLVGLFLLTHALNGILEQPDLDKACFDRKEDTGAGQQIDQTPSVDCVVDAGEQIGQVHEILLFSFCSRR